MTVRLLWAVGIMSLMSTGRSMRRRELEIAIGRPSFKPTMLTSSTLVQERMQKQVWVCYSLVVQNTPEPCSFAHLAFEQG
jgi:hypothetical protein